MIAQLEAVVDDKTRERFEEILYGHADQRTQHASCIVDFLSDKNDQIQIELLTLLLENYGIPGRESGAVLGGRKIDNERYLELAGTLDEMIHGTMKLIIHSRRQPRDAARVLRDMIFSFDNNEQRDYCLAEIMADDAVPYRPIPQSSMMPFPPERLRKIAEGNVVPLAQIRAVIRAGMDTTLQADLILKVLDSINNHEDRVGIFEVGVLGLFMDKLKMARGRS